jgi:hypothetical protein
MISDFGFRISDFHTRPLDGLGWLGTQNSKLKTQNSGERASGIPNSYFLIPTSNWAAAQ